MDQKMSKILNELNRAIIKYRGIYSIWSYLHGISYNEMLVMYTIREFGFCTQKQICDSYLLPRQTINHVIASMVNKGLLEYSREYSAGREKAFILTECGKKYANPLISSLSSGESMAIQKLGEDKIQTLTALLTEYYAALNDAFNNRGE